MPPSQYIKGLAKKIENQIQTMPHGEVDGPSLEFDPHQQEANRAILYGIMQQQRSQVSVIASCGSGKTAVEMNMIAASQAAKEDLEVSGNRKDILISIGRATIEGIKEQFSDIGLEAGIWHGGKRDLEPSVIIASIQALQMAQKRKELRKLLPPGTIDMCVIDEADCFLTPSRKKVIEKLAPKVKIGLTATPDWPDGRSITDEFGPPVMKLNLREGILRGINARPEVFFYQSEIRSEDIKMKEGDYDPKMLDAALRQAEIHKAIPKVYKQILRTKQERRECPTLIYVPSVNLVRATVETMQEEFGDDVFIVGWTGADVSTSQLEAGMDFFRSGDIQVAVLCEMGGRGMNLENAKLLIDAYPTMSLNKLEQRHGRVLRKVRKDSKLWKMGQRKEKAVIAQIVPKSLEYRPALFTDILGGYQQLQALRASAENNGETVGAPMQDIVDVIRRRIEEEDPTNKLKLIKRIDALEAIKRYDQYPQASDEKGFFYLPKRYGIPTAKEFE